LQFLWQLKDVMLRGDGRPRLNHVSCRIMPGITAVLGASGAGKTSLLNLLVGMEQADSGSIHRPDRRDSARLPLFWAPQGGGLWPHLSVRRHLEAVCQNSDEPDKLLNEFDLIDRQHAFPDELSQGEKARLSVARSLAAAPEILLFDEPLVHVDGSRKQTGWHVIRQHVEHTGTSVILTTHEPDVVLREADQVICLDEGRVVYEGRVMQLYRDPPDERCGRFLGPLNWFTAKDRSVWLQNDQSDLSDLPRCVRPECLLIVPNDNTAAAEVVSSHFMGTHAETTVTQPQTGVTRVVIHRPAAALTARQRVSVRVIAGDSPEANA